MPDQAAKSKKCTKCGETKPLDAFGKDAQAKGGCRSWCKACRNADARCRYAANPEKQHEAGRHWRKANPERVCAISRRYRQAYPEKAKAAVWRWKQANQEETKAYGRQYYQAHLEQARAHSRQYRREHPEVSRAAGHRRRARKMDLPHDLTVRQWQKTLFAFDHRCAYCGEVAHPDNCSVHGCLVREHVVPLSSGGGYVFGNIVPACEQCNNSKFTADYRDWMQRNGYDAEAFGAILGNLASPPMQFACQSRTIS